MPSPKPLAQILPFKRRTPAKPELTLDQVRQAVPDIDMSVRWFLGAGWSVKLQQDPTTKALRFDVHDQHGERQLHGLDAQALTQVAMGFALARRDIEQ